MSAGVVEDIEKKIDETDWSKLLKYLIPTVLISSTVSNFLADHVGRFIIDRGIITKDNLASELNNYKWENNEFKRK